MKFKLPARSPLPIQDHIIAAIILGLPFSLIAWGSNIHPNIFSFILAPSLLVLQLLKNHLLFGWLPFLFFVFGQFFYYLTIVSIASGYFLSESNSEQPVAREKPKALWIIFPATLLLGFGLTLLGKEIFFKTFKWETTWFALSPAFCIVPTDHNNRTFPEPLLTVAFWSLQTFYYLIVSSLAYWLAKQGEITKKALYKMSFISAFVNPFCLIGAWDVNLAEKFDYDLNFGLLVMAISISGALLWGIMDIQKHQKVGKSLFKTTFLILMNLVLFHLSPRPGGLLLIYQRLNLY